jgi:multicomponent Na+:H+ antiporter subunit E
MTWIVLAAFWIGLSGYFDAIHLIFGAVSVTIVSALSHKHLVTGAGQGEGLGRAIRTIYYIPWLLWQVALANIDVFLRVIGVRSIDPRMIRIKVDLESEYGLTLLANSITLTPGTVTVDIEEDGTLLVHALAPEAAEGVLSRVMERRVREVESGIRTATEMPVLVPDAPAGEEDA